MPAAAILAAVNSRARNSDRRASYAILTTMREALGALAFLGPVLAPRHPQSSVRFNRTAKLAPKTQREPVRPTRDGGLFRTTGL